MQLQTQYQNFKITMWYHILTPNRTNIPISYVLSCIIRVVQRQTEPSWDFASVNGGQIPAYLEEIYRQYNTAPVIHALLFVYDTFV